MIPRVAKMGTSFKGAGLYYLHDKGAQTTERVAWAETANLATNDPDRALRQMAQTAMASEKLKQAAGVRIGGRQSKTPVYCYSLAWHPDETPSRDEMMTAARDTLKVLGLDQHQAVFVAHNDTDHKHVHIIVNRIDPMNGKTASNSNDQLKLSKWAEAYDRERGKDYCPDRTQNNQKRAQGSYVRHNSDKTLWRRVKTRQQRQANQSAKNVLWKEQERIRVAEFAKINAQKAATIASIKQEFKPEWAAVFKSQRESRRKLEKLTRTFVGRLHLVITRGADFGLTAQDVFRPQAILRAVERRQEVERSWISAKQSKAFTARLRPLDRQKTALVEAQKIDRKDLGKKQDSELQALWRKQAIGLDRDEFAKFEDRAQKTSLNLRDALIKAVGQEAVLEAELQAKKINERRKRERENERGGRTLDF